MLECLKSLVSNTMSIQLLAPLEHLGAENDVLIFVMRICHGRQVMLRYISLGRFRHKVGGKASRRRAEEAVDHRSMQVNKCLCHDGKIL